MNRALFLQVDEGSGLLPPEPADVEPVGHIEATEATRLHGRSLAVQCGHILLSEDRKADVTGLRVDDDCRRPMLKPEPPELRDRNVRDCLARGGAHLDQGRRREVLRTVALARAVD